MRMPEGSIGFRWSKGIMFLLTVMPQRSRASSACRPVSAQRGHVGQHQVVVGAAADQLHARRPGSTSARVLALSMICRAYCLKAGCEGLAEADRLAGDDVHQRPALRAGEHGPVDVLGVRLLAEDHAAARAAQRLVRGRWSRSRPPARGSSCSLAATRPGVMGHVDQQLGPALAGDLGELAVRHLAADRRWPRPRSASACARGPARPPGRSRSGACRAARRS